MQKWENRNWYSAIIQYSFWFKNKNHISPISLSVALVEYWNKVKKQHLNGWNNISSFCFSLKTMLSVYGIVTTCYFYLFNWRAPNNNFINNFLASHHSLDMVLVQTALKHFIQRIINSFHLCWCRGDIGTRIILWNYSN